MPLETHAGSIAFVCLVTESEPKASIYISIYKSSQSQSQPLSNPNFISQFRERERMYKTKVQELCQKKQWRPPMYSTMKDGPDHYPRFNSSVSVNGLLFHSPFPSKSSKDAQNAAAKLAFLHFTGTFHLLTGPAQPKAYAYPKNKNNHNYRLITTNSLVL